jgi:hypothetical protein
LFSVFRRHASIQQSVACEGKHREASAAVAIEVKERSESKVDSDWSWRIVRPH